MNEKTDMHIFVWRACPPAIQCACPFFHSYLKETKKINNQFLIRHFNAKAWIKFCSFSTHLLMFIFCDVYKICFTHIRLSLNQLLRPNFSFEINCSVTKERFEPHHKTLTWRFNFVLIIHFLIIGILNTVKVTMSVWVTKLSGENFGCHDLPKRTGTGLMKKRTTSSAYQIPPLVNEEN